jgi:suppressor of G2 allele of SKP1
MNLTSEYSFSIDPLFALVDSAESKSRILSTKIEVTLKKATPGRKWSALEGSEPLKKSTNGTDNPAKAAVMSSLQQPTTTSAPSYPTSSKSGPKNWDKVAADLTKKKKQKDKDKTDDSDDDDDDDKVESDSEGGDAVDSFFKKLYAGADPDTRRAMMKSYQESNGTALSTNWEDVGKRRVEPVESSKDD